MSENFEDKVDIKETHGVGFNSGNIVNSTFAKTIINDTKNVSRKDEPAEFPNNLNILRTGAVKFVGRDKDIKNLHEQLQEKERVSITAVVTGMAGVGKTELALQYSLLSEKELKYPGGICWINVRERSVAEQLLSFAQTQLGLFPAEDWSLEERISYCWSNWQPPGDVLIVLDDVNKYEEIEQYLPPQKQRFKLLITTRKYWLSDSFSQLRLEVLDEDSALELLEVLIGNSRLGTQIEEAKQLCEWLGYLPLGLELVGRFLKRRSEWTLERMIQELEKQALNFSVLQNPQGEMTAQRGVAAAFELSWNELDERGRYLGCLLSLFALAPIPWNLVEKCLSKDESREKGIIQRWFSTFSHLWLLLMSPKKVDVLDSRTWEDIREDILLDLNLIQKTAQGTYELHQLVRRYFQDKLNAMKEVEQLKSQFCRVIVGAAEKIPQNITVEQVKEVEIDIPHITEIADNLAEYLSDDDLITPFTSLGSFYLGQGLYPLAQPWLEKGKEIAEKRLDKNNSDIAAAYSYLAKLYNAQGKYEAAEPLLLQAIEIDKIALPENHPGIATDLNNLAVLYCEKGKYEAAEPLYLQAIEIDKIALPENHPQRASGLNNLAELYREQGKYEAAEPLYLQAIEIHKIALPENHPSIATNLNNLAGLYELQGKYEAAEPLFLEAIKISVQLLGEKHPNTQTFMKNYQIFLNEKNKSK
jgi:tetratricopeptide (TPR) repeat protein